jgi:hypothetical protein
VSAKPSALMKPMNPGRHTRPASRTGLRKACLAVLIMLVVQYGLGIFLNLYVSVPASDHDAGIAHEIASGPGSLTLHATLGLILIVTSAVLLARAIAARSRVIILLAALGLSAILGAFAAGEVFVRGGGSNDASRSMALLTGVALLSYIGTLALVSMARLDPAPVAQHLPAPAEQHVPAPPLPGRPPVSPPDVWSAASRQRHVPAGGAWPASPRQPEVPAPEAWPAAPSPRSAGFRYREE